MKPLHEVVREARRLRREWGYKDSYYSILVVAAAVYADYLSGRLPLHRHVVARTLKGPTP